MITAPWLGARHGFAKATRALAEAFTDTKDMVRATYAGKGVKDGWRSEFDWSQKYPEGTDEHKLFHALLDRNLLDITMEESFKLIMSAGIVAPGLPFVMSRHGEVRPVRVQGDEPTVEVARTQPVTGSLEDPGSTGGLGEL